MVVASLSPPALSPSATLLSLSPPATLLSLSPLIAASNYSASLPPTKFGFDGICNLKPPVVIVYFFYSASDSRTYWIVCEKVYKNASTLKFSGS